MSIRLSIVASEGNRRSFESAENIADSTRTGIEKAFWRSGKTLIKKFKEQVLDRKAKSGRIYFRRTAGGQRRRHQASAPNESPANRSGFYRKQIGFIVRGSKELAFGNSAEYAEFLEVGTSRMNARPGLGNAVTASERNIIRNFATEMSDEI